MTERLIRLSKRLGRIARRLLFVFSVTLAVLWLGGMLVLHLLAQFFPRAI